MGLCSLGSAFPHNNFVFRVLFGNYFPTRQNPGRRKNKSGPSVVPSGSLWFPLVPAFPVCFRSALTSWSSPFSLPSFVFPSSFSPARVCPERGVSKLPLPFLSASLRLSLGLDAGETSVVRCACSCTNGRPRGRVPVLVLTPRGAAVVAGGWDPARRSASAANCVPAA